MQEQERIYVPPPTMPGIYFLLVITVAFTLSCLFGPRLIVYAWDKLVQPRTAAAAEAEREEAAAKRRFLEAVQDCQNENPNCDRNTEGIRLGLVDEPARPTQPVSTTGSQ